MDKIRLLAGALLVLVCLSATASVSTSLTWTWHNPPTPDALTTIAYGGGIYVTAGQDGVIYTSHDGNTWSRESSIIGAGGEYRAILYGNGLFVLAGTDAAGAVHVTSSPDGVVWTDSVVAVPLIGGFFKLQLELAYGNGTYILMGGGADATSSDGTSWSVNPIAFSSEAEFPSLLFANGVFIKFGVANSHDDIYYSTDGITWTASTSLRDIADQGPYATDGHTFYLFFENANFVYTSTDGNVWTKHASIGNLPMQETFMSWDGTHFRSIGFDASARTHAFSSTDGLTWSQSSDLSGTLPSSTVVFDGTHYFSPTAGFVEVLSSTDFQTWTPALVASTGPQADFDDILHAGGHFVAR